MKSAPWQVLIFFFFSFCWSGISSVVAQLFLLNVAPDHKSSYLSSLMFTATITSIIALQVSEKFRNFFFTRLAKYPLILTLGMSVIVGLALTIVTTQHLWVFVSTTLALCLVFNIYENLTDQYLITNTSPLKQNQYNQWLLMVRLMAWMLAPLYFSYSYGHWWNPVLLSILGLVAITCYYLIFSKNTAGDSPELKHHNKSQSLVAQDFFFFGYIFPVMSGSTLFIAMQIYILRDHFGFENAATLGGTFITLANIAAVIAIMMQRKLKPPAIIAQTGAPLMYLVSIILMMSEVVVTEVGIGVLALGCGLAVGAFLDHSRNWATKVATKGRPKVLTLYNNLFNISALVAFSLGFILTKWTEGKGFYMGIFTIIIVLQIVGLVGLSGWRRSNFA